ncbi:hypothetical protein [Sedimentibacter sp.]|uniref:hypothetical protein n=1 Tax=Sedimentibacter sp. TaxID=1960295 RepID=UPI0028AC391D|nr:hypothetical protein [Sedimentibacter sp.]
MTWIADIHLKSGGNVVVENLECIQTKYDADINHVPRKYTDFKDFIFLNQNFLSFSGKDITVTLPGNTIEYIVLISRA